ncbi:MAG: TetR/AcrR family transcriptional regulator [Spirochaetia bacterium]
MTVKKSKGPTREQFIETALSQIDKSTGLRDLNLRKVAKAVGCAHTNVYNYFSSFDDLLWYALRDVLKKMIGFSAHTLEENAGFADFVESHIDFALGHKGWYRFIWIDRLSGEPPAEVYEYFSVPANQFLEKVASAARKRTDDEYVKKAAEILHGYLHGKLCILVSDREDSTDRNAVKKDIVSGITLLFSSLFPENNM